MITANIALDILGIILSLIPIVYLISNHRYQQKLNQYFLGVAVSNIFMIVGDLADWLIQDAAEPSVKLLLTLFTVMFYVASAFVLYFFAGYMGEYLKLPVRVKKLYLTVIAVVCGAQVFFAVISPFTDSIFYVSDRGYQRGSLFIISQLIPLFCYILFTVLVIVYRKRLNWREVVFFLLYIFVPLGGGAIQMFLRGVAVVNIGVALALLFILVNIQFEHEITLRKQEKKLAELRIDIMLSQIQPHFLYNVLTGIRTLCEMDPIRAGESIVTFSKFLRANMESLTNKSPIPFEQELAHTRSYLYLEQQRFEDKLNIIYEINTTAFTIPPLTLQPIVENAVRHGIMKKKDGGILTIRSEETDGAYMVTVIDDGVGFSVEQRKTAEYAHIGIENVKNRLNALCGGTIEVQSEPQNGTTVTICVPKES